VPSTVWVLDEPFPRSPSGKLLKREHRERLVAGKA
jgi:acyl-CoA synthetase (AMP-forming)/AMP-acid ligase II